MGSSLTQATAGTHEPLGGDLVNYHGSNTWMHGEWQVAAPCICQRCAARVIAGMPVRWELVDTWGRDRIWCVRRESFTLYDDMPQAEPAPEHKTRTSQPHGYYEVVPGVRSFDKRGRPIRDRFSFWSCTCGAIGAGATREEARSWARRHREEEAAALEARFQAAIAAARTRLAA